MNGAKAAKASGFLSIADKLKSVKLSPAVKKNMDDPDRYVPIEILKETILKWVKRPDPQWSTGYAYYHKMTRNWKEYNLKVIYEENINTIWHFHYQP